MLQSVARTTLRSANQATGVRAFAAGNPWGTDLWRHEKKAFLKWTTQAAKAEPSVARREFYGFIATAFGDVDIDKDGKIDLEQFDRLLEKVAAVPRRYGLAPQATETYVSRISARKKIFDALDTAEGKARGFLALDQFVTYAYDHIAEKVKQVPDKDTDLYHPEDYNVTEYLDFMNRAVRNAGSYERSSFYNFMLTIFVEADVECKGRVSYDQFDLLLDRAAKVPRHFGLAPAESDPATRKTMFEKMELKRDGKPTGFVTMRTFWEWNLEHTLGKLDEHAAGKGFKK